MELARAALAHVLAHFEHHAEIASTNDRGMELARDTSISLPALVVAEKQTAGRGRGANRWWSADGALTFSLVVDLSTAVPRERWPLAALTAGLAVCDAVARLVENEKLAVKWPNDVYASGRKLCGILVETPAAPAGRLVIGIGVNVNNSFAAAPPDVRARGVSLVELANRPQDVDAVLASIVGELIDLLPTLADSPPAVVARWPAHCLLTGRIVEVETPAGPMIGLCEGINETGALLLCDELGQRRCVAGTVVRW